MSAPTQGLVSRAARFLFADGDEPALWAISVRGRVVGSLVCERGEWRLSWFNDADPRLDGLDSRAIGDTEILANALSTRLGAPVHIESLAV
jgi:hypothetical protein